MLLGLFVAIHGKVVGDVAWLVSADRLIRNYKFSKKRAYIGITGDLCEIVTALSAENLNERTREEAIHYCLLESRESDF